MGRNTVPIKAIKKPTLSEGWVAVDSKCLTEIGYDLPTETMWLGFKSSGLFYQYPGVPKHLYDELAGKTGGGMGAFFVKVIKPLYPAVEVWAEDA